MDGDLPGRLRALLRELGFTWPEADAWKIYQLGTEWAAFGESLDEPLRRAETVAARVAEEHNGEAAETFGMLWREPDEAPAVLRDTVSAAYALRVGAYATAAVVTALKAAIVVQLVALATAIAKLVLAATVTGGLSLAMIPVARQAAAYAIGLAIEAALSRLLG
jgi:hypothetical protein